MARLWSVLVVCVLSTWIQTLAHAQAVGSTTYKSEVDELLTVQSISVLPFSDNVQGIYSRPLETYFSELLNEMHRFDVAAVNSVGPILSPEELEENLNSAQLMAGGITADAFFACRVVKGPNGVSMTLSLFLTKDAKLLAKSTLKDSQRFDLKDLRVELKQLLSKVVAQIPYQGRILSRDAQRVTVNVGKRDGIEVGQIISVIQLIGITRHPKFNFLVSTEKEIIGRIKVLKVDETLSFATIISEKEKGAIRKNAKIAGLDFVTYSDSGSLDDPSGGKNLGARDDGKVAFGDNPSAWVPRKTPSFGQVSARLGNTLYNGSMNLSGVSALNSNTWLAPSVALDGELWITPNWTVHAGFKQGIIPIDNPRDGAAPNSLNQSLTQYQLLFGYTFRIDGSVWGPAVEALLGYMSYRLYVDSSSPEAYTTMTYTGFKTGVRGHLPVSADRRWFAGAEFFILFKPRLSESPVTSGSDVDNSINMFGVYGFRKMSENLKLIGKLDFEQYATNFSGNGSRTEDATSSSQRHTTLSAGLAYMF